MYKYIILGKKIISDFRFQCAFEGDFEIEDITICQGVDAEVHNSLAEHELEDRHALRYLASDFARFHYKNNGTFEIVEGKEIRYQLVDGFDESFVEQIFLCLCLPLLLTQLDEFAIHGSALNINDKAIIVSGRSGAGKSTLANAIVEKYNSYLSDDIVPICFENDEVYAVPSFPCRKLCFDAAEAFRIEDIDVEIIDISDVEGAKKGILDRKRYFADINILNAIFVINPSDVSRVTINEVTGAEALKLIVDNLFRISDYSAKGITPVVMQNIMKIAQKVKVYEIYRPLEGLTVDEQLKAIEGIL